MCIVYVHKDKQKSNWPCRFLNTLSGVTAYSTPFVYNNNNIYIKFVILCLNQLSDRHKLQYTRIVLENYLYTADVYTYKKKCFFYIPIPPRVRLYIYIRKH